MGIPQSLLKELYIMSLNPAYPKNLERLKLELVKPPPRPKKIRIYPKVGRNDPCPCESRKKYKKCHGA